MGIDKKHVEGGADELKGNLKEGVGKLTGDRDLQGEGRFDQLKGKVEKGLGDIRQKGEELLDKGKAKIGNLHRDSDPERK